ncbi:hypothetical protein SAY87_008513 [Trapa incisa]|uniref:Uncharacterized protein n=1 Tax=Trapa incisa TaxID=236973 RepID=A0AAN7PVW0_9MYRT|nr:hypothetical protein SAY87_008513 [Trapa incisa]
MRTSSGLIVAMMPRRCSVLMKYESTIITEMMHSFQITVNDSIYKRQSHAPPLSRPLGMRSFSQPHAKDGLDLNSHNLHLFLYTSRAEQLRLRGHTSPTTG